MALELGAGGQVRSPMAIAVIGGIATSTISTLVVVPTLFTYYSAGSSPPTCVWKSDSDSFLVENKDLIEFQSESIIVPCCP